MPLSNPRAIVLEAAERAKGDMRAYAEILLGAWRAAHPELDPADAMIEAHEPSVVGAPFRFGIVVKEKTEKPDETSLTPEKGGGTSTPLPCPFCGQLPRVGPEQGPDVGTCWGYVRCEHPACPAQPSVGDGIPVADSRGLAAYQASAIERWNQRAR